jgi:hypothetical protein
MTDTEDAIVVFTARSPDRIIREGGSQAWVLNGARAKNCTWLVCTQNRHNPDHEFSDATQPHGTAFLLGKISGIRETVEESKDGKQRWLVAISEFARINLADVWDHGRNPVRYTSLKELGIDPVKAKFQAMPKDDAAPSSRGQPSVAAAAGMLTIAEAKKALAATFGVKPDAVEITIRG